MDQATSYLCQLATYYVLTIGTADSVSQCIFPPKTAVPYRLRQYGRFNDPNICLVRVINLQSRLVKAVAAVSWVVHMYAVARIEVAVWLRLLSELPSPTFPLSPSTAPTILLVTKNFNDYSMIFSSGLEDLHRIRNTLRNNARMWSALPSYPLLQVPTASQDGSVNPKDDQEASEF